MERLDDFGFIAKLIYNAYNIPIILLDAEMNVVVEHHWDNKNPVYLTKKDFVSSLFQEEDEIGFPFLKVTNFLENVVMFHVENEHKRKSTIIIGPCLLTDVTKEMVSGIIEDFRIPSYYQESLIDYYDNLLKLSQKELMNIAQLAYFLLYDKRIDETLLTDKLIPAINKEENVEKQVQMRRIEASFHMDQRKEQYIWECIKEGHKEKLIEHLKSLKVEGIGVLSKRSHLRHTKNHSIIAVALATRAAIEGGLYPEIAFTMSDIYIQQIEDSNEAHQINLYVQEYLFELIDRIQKNKLSKQSKPVRICKNYIFNHIFEDITINKLAEIVHLNPIYLSQLFKKETGQSLGKYIQQEKINEAKKMLIQSDSSIAEICMLLQFSDQSYFTSAFKKYTGVTPSQYRKNPTS